VCNLTYCYHSVQAKFFILVLLRAQHLLHVLLQNVNRPVHNCAVNMIHTMKPQLGLYFKQLPYAFPFLRNDSPCVRAVHLNLL
jgi:hypothetical protein